ncbi:MAG: DUF2723 domain-containing protein [Gemmatimonadota bacterium]|nr:MAG: DUF2723 domain-containing protein [Gemmatimonadota bacterium]
MTSSDVHDAAPVARPPYLLAGAVFLVVLGIYLLTIAPTTQFWDTSEYIAAAKVQGIPHPPGNPLFVLLAGVWGMIPLVEHYALRINLFAAATSALASALLFLVAERFLRDIVPEVHWARIGAAFAGALVGATSFTVWNQSVVNEKVYTLSLLSIAIVLWLAVRWGDEPAGERRDHWLILIVYLVALSATNHLMGLLAVPAVLVYVEAAEADTRLWERVLGAGALLAGAALAGMLFLSWHRDHQDLASLVVSVVLLAGVTWPTFRLRTSPLTRIGIAAAVAGVAGGIVLDAWDGRDILPVLLALALLATLFAFAFRSGNTRLVLVSLGAVAVGLSVFLFLPLRAQHFPAVNEGEPTTRDALLRVLSREQYQKGPLLPRQASLYWQYANYVQYFTWQFAHDWGQRVRNLLALLFAGIGLLGAVRQWQKDRRGALAMTALMVTVTLLLVFYLDFKYGYSIRPGESLLREVRERDYFFIASFQLWGVWVALGLGAWMAWFATAFGDRLRGGRAWLMGSPILLAGAIPLLGNHLSASRGDEWLARDFAWDLLQSVEPYAIVITAGDNDMFPLWYMQEVEGVRRDVLIANLSLMNTDWHVRQLKRRPIYPFDQADAVSLYREGSWVQPTDSAVSLSFDDIDALPYFYEITERSVFRVGDMRLVLEPRVLERSDIITLQLIQDNLGKRPIYFSRTVGPYADMIGLTPYLLGQGMARKVMSDSVTRADGAVPIRTLGWVDPERHETLLFEVYHAESAARPRPRGWVDTPSEGILSLYALLYAGWAEYVTGTMGDSATTAADSLRRARAERATDLADRIFRQTSYSGN